MDLSKTSWISLTEHAIVLLCAGYLIRKILKNGIANTFTKFAVSAAQTLPGAKTLLAKEQKESLKVIEQSIFKGIEDNNIIESIPEEGLSSDLVLEILDSWRNKEGSYRAGKAFGGIYHNYHEVEALERKALSLFCDTNGLYPTTFPGLRKIEAEVVRMACNLLHGDEATCGTMTSGGSESILIALKAYRDRGIQKYGIKNPEMIIPDSAHAAFIKGAHYFGIKLVLVPVREDKRVDIKELKKAITSNTVLIVASAPSFPHGVIDPVEEIAEIIKNLPQIGLHVDACLGGFILPWLQQLGHVKTKYDFEIPRVTSISADLHKYGFAPKGASVILWKDSTYRKFQYFAYCDWSGGIYCSPAIQGSRAGGPMAGAWAVLVHLGQNGFLKAASHYHKAFTTIVEGIKKIEGLELVSEPDACTIAYSSTVVDIYKIGDAMERRGWLVNRLQRPRCLQIQVGARENFDADDYVKTLEESVRDVINNPDNYVGGLAGVYGLAATLADANAVAPLKEIVSGYLDALYQTRASE